MRKFGVVLAVVLCALLCGCTSLWTYELDDALPPVLDEYTLLPQIESLTVTRESDGAQITLSGTDVESLMMCFENIVCVRRKSPPPAAAYVVEFHMTDHSDVRDPLIIGEVKSSKAIAFGVGEYLYESINMQMDVRYLEQLFFTADS